VGNSRSLAGAPWIVNDRTYATLRVGGLGGSQPRISLRRKPVNQPRQSKVSSNKKRFAQFTHRGIGQVIDIAQIVLDRMAQQNAGADLVEPVVASSQRSISLKGIIAYNN
jgi:hypothetical protein